MNKSLLLAILSLDSYNRGYGAGIRGLSNAGHLGLARFFVEEPAIDWKENGFFALSYDVSSVQGFNNGDLVIALRGTDKNLTLPWNDSDLVNGYGIADNDPNGDQAEIAKRLYVELTGLPLGQAATKVTLAGHSLGGGLAGFLAAASGTKAVLFDHMPFGGAAVSQAIAMGREASFSDIMSYFVQGEFLSTLRSLSLPDERAVLQPGLNSYEDTFAVGSIDLHSQALMVSLLYANDPANVPSSDWKVAASSLWNAFFDDEAASKIPEGEFRRGDGATIDDVVRSAIAYSAISEGEDEGKPFGDTGIVAMFDDANELGRALGSGSTPDSLVDHADAIAQTTVHYAGELALNDIEKEEQPSAADGILSLIGEGRVLAIDYTDAIWTAASGGSAPAGIAGRDALLDELLTGDTRTLMQSQWGTSVNDQIGRVALSATTIGATVTLQEAGGAKATLFVGAEGSEEVTGTAGRDLLLGGNGEDKLIGGAGDDILIGGSANDNLYAGSGHDLLVGGESAAGGDSYILNSTDNGVVTIRDDGGNLVIDGVKIGGKLGVAEDGSLASGVALAGDRGYSEGDPSTWQLGDYHVTKEGADLVLKSAAQEIRLQNTDGSAYGISLEARSASDVAIEQTLYQNPDYLAEYLYIDDRGRHEWKKYYATDQIEPGWFVHTILGRQTGYGFGMTVRDAEIAGTAGNDALDFTSYAATNTVTVHTGAGSDVVSALADRLNAQEVYTGSGRDFVTGFGGLGIIDAGDGRDDIVLYADVSGNNRPQAALTEIYAGSDDDRIFGVNGAVIDGGDGDDTWTVWSWDAFSPINSYYPENYAYLHALHLDTQTGDFSVDSTPYAGKFTNIERFIIDAPYGQYGGAAGDDYIVTLAGDDYISVGDGANIVRSGAGNDVIRVGRGKNDVDAGAGDDGIASSGSGVIRAGEGNDSVTIFETAGPLTIFGEAGDDNLINPSGRTFTAGVTFVGGPGDDRLYGGYGVDTAVYTGTWLDYAIHVDPRTASGLDGPVTATIADNRGDDGSDTIDFVEKYSFSNGTFTAAEIVNYTPVARDEMIAVTVRRDPTAAASLLTNDTDKNLATVNLGEKLLVGKVWSYVAEAEVSGRTSIKGYYGTLTLQPNGSAIYSLGGGRYSADGYQVGQSTQEAFAYEVTDAKGLTARAYLTVQISGSSEPAPVLPVAVQDELILTAGVANRVPTGRLLANDTNAASGELHFAALNPGGLPAGATFALDGDSVVVTPYPGTTSGSFTYEVSNVNGSAFGSVLYQAIASSEANDVLVMADATAPAYLFGRGGDDRLAGGTNSDRLDGGSGADRLEGNAGDDWLDGGTGNDSLRGGAARDVFAFIGNQNTGKDTILDFGADDLLVTTSPIYDSNGDGIITFGGNRVLDLVNGGSVSIANDRGSRMQRLEYDGFVDRGETRYYVYSTVGSTVGVDDLAA